MQINDILGMIKVWIFTDREGVFKLLSEFLLPYCFSNGSWFAMFSFGCRFSCEESKSSMLSHNLASVAEGELLEIAFYFSPDVAHGC